MLDLEYYGNFKYKATEEGDGYYFRNYESPRAFEEDEKLQTLFLDVQDAIDAFFRYLDNKIEEFGGDPDEYVA